MTRCPQMGTRMMPEVEAGPQREVCSAISRGMIPGENVGFNVDAMRAERFIRIRCWEESGSGNGYCVGISIMHVYI